MLSLLSNYNIMIRYLSSKNNLKASDFLKKNLYPIDDLCSCFLVDNNEPPETQIHQHSIRVSLYSCSRIKLSVFIVFIVNRTFQVFKLFVANPNKSQEVVSVFLANRAKLVAYLECFHLDNTDPQFVDEKRLLIE